MRQPSARLSLYTSETAERRGMAINFVGRGGRRPLGRRGIAINVVQTAEATSRRHYLRR
jgi:hypothetical protein